MHSKPKQEAAMGASRGKTIAKSRSQKKDDSIMGVSFSNNENKTWSNLAQMSARLLSDPLLFTNPRSKIALEETAAMPAGTG